MALDSTEVTVRPTGAAAAKKHSNLLSIIILSVMIVLIFVCAVGINLVLDAPIGMWVLSIFGGVVISVLLTGVAVHSMRQGPF